MSICSPIKLRTNEAENQENLRTASLDSKFIVCIAKSVNLVFLRIAFLFAFFFNQNFFEPNGSVSSQFVTSRRSDFLN